MILTRPEDRAVYEEADAELRLLRSTRFAGDTVRTLQEAKLIDLLGRATETPYYAGKITPEASSFMRLPKTPKALVKTQPHLFTRTRARAIKYYETSGTTGVPTATPRSVADIVRNVMSVASAWSDVIRPGDRVATLLPSDLSPIGDLTAGVCEYLGACLVRAYPFALGICDWDRIEQLMSRFEPTCLFAAPGVILQLTRILKRREVFSRASESVRTILLLGEVSTPALRSLLARTWRSEVFDASYGSTETGTIAATCGSGGLHALEHSYLLEVQTQPDVEALSPVVGGVDGELVVTTLNSDARPLLRLATGDLVEFSPTPCACGWAYPTLQVRGRQGERVSIKGTALDAHLAESIVYEVPEVTGYLVEMTPDGARARLLLERDVDCVVDERQQLTMAFDRSRARGIDWDEVSIVSDLPTISKSGAGQKNWKRTNVRVWR